MKTVDYKCFRLLSHRVTQKYFEGVFTKRLKCSSVFVSVCYIVQDPIAGTGMRAGW